MRDYALATLFGYTHDEVLKCFPGRIHELAEAQGLTDAGAFGEIIKWYDGYRFEENAQPVINPVFLGQCFQRRKFANYWAETAMEQIRGKDYAGKYALSKKRIILVGISFSFEKRTIVDVLFE